MSPAIQPSRRRALPAAAAALFAAALSGCAHNAGAMASGGLPSEEDARCAAAANQGVALISEWSPAEKANLEQALRGGAVAVEHLGCRLRVLSQCRVGGGYTWQRTGPAQSSVDIDGEQALYERLPLSAAALQPDLQRAGKLRVTTQVAGELRLQQGATALPPEGECEYATHVITSVTLGASVLSGGDGRMIRSAGDPQACNQATAAGPNPGCAVPLQLSLAPVPGRGPQEPPPGMAQVDIVSDFPEQTWDVYVGEDHVCTTPCTQWLDPMRPIFLKSQGRRTDEIWLPALGPEVMETRSGMLVATGHNRAKFAVGTTFTTLGGMGLVVGIVFTAVGCSNLAERSGECTAGLITGGVSIPITTVFLLMLIDSNPKADVFPVLRTQPGRAQIPVTVKLLPTGIAGTF